MPDQVAVAFLLTLLAGLSTALGALVVFFVHRPSMRLLSFGLGLSGGVMIYISLVELLPQACASMASVLGPKGGAWAAHGAFFGGILVSAVIDRLVPEPENPHEAIPAAAIDRAYHEAGGACAPEPDEPQPSDARSTPALARVGLLTALIIGLHNFPEGIATFVASASSTSLGISIAIAVAIHNIPEGVAVAVPIFTATGSRQKAFVYALLSGLAEPLGAFLVYVFLMPFVTPTLTGALLAGVAGIMVFISLDELLPTAREYGEGHLAIGGVVAGMAVMAVSLLLQK